MILMATPLDASRGTGKKKLSGWNWRGEGTNFSCDFSCKVKGILPQISYKPP